MGKTLATLLAAGSLLLASCATSSPKPANPSIVPNSHYGQSSSQSSGASYGMTPSTTTPQPFQYSANAFSATQLQGRATTAADLPHSEIGYFSFSPNGEKYVGLTDALIFGRDTNDDTIITQDETFTARAITRHSEAIYRFVEGNPTTPNDDRLVVGSDNPAALMQVVSVPSRHANLTVRAANPFVIKLGNTDTMSVPIGNADMTYQNSSSVGGLNIGNISGLGPAENIPGLTIDGTLYAATNMGRRLRVVTFNSNHPYVLSESVLDAQGNEVFPTVTRGTGEQFLDLPSFIPVEGMPTFSEAERDALPVSPTPSTNQPNAIRPGRRRVVL